MSINRAQPYTRFERNLLRSFLMVTLRLNCIIYSLCMLRFYLYRLFLLHNISKSLCHYRTAISPHRNDLLPRNVMPPCFLLTVSEQTERFHDNVMINRYISAFQTELVLLFLTTTITTNQFGHDFIRCNTRSTDFRFVG